MHKKSIVGDILALDLANIAIIVTLLFVLKITFTQHDHKTKHIFDLVQVVFQNFRDAFPGETNVPNAISKQIIRLQNKFLRLNSIEIGLLQIRKNSELMVKLIEFSVFIKLQGNL